MSEERDLGQIQTAWVRGATDSKMGKAILTSQRVLFFDSKFMGGAWHELLRRALTEEAGRKVIDDGPDSWRIQES